MNPLAIAFKEIIPELKIPEKWKEILLNTGGTQSTLQDIILPQAGGGYWYKESLHPILKNRFITWQTTKDSIELSEWALDFNLKGSNLRCKASAGTPPLNNVTIWEHGSEVILLAATISSVHRLIFPHPVTLLGKSALNAAADPTASIFNDSLSGSANNPLNYYIFTQTSTAKTVECSSMLSSKGDAVFAIWCGASPDSALLVITMPKDKPAVTLSLRKESVVPRFLSGLTEALRGKQNISEDNWSVCVNDFGIVALSANDSCLRLWRPPSQTIAAMSQPLLAHAHSQGEKYKYMLKQVIRQDNSIILVAFLTFSTECEFVILNLTEHGGNIKFVEISRVYGPQADLIDFNITYSGDDIVIWAIWLKPDGESVITRNASGKCWEYAEEGRKLEDLEELDSPNAYVDKLLQPASFPLAVVRKALQVYSRAWCGGITGGSILEGGSGERESVRDAALRAITARLQRAPHTSPHRCWSDLYSWCVQYMEGLRKPLGLLLPIHKSFEEVWIVRHGGVSLVSKCEPFHLLMATQDYPSDPQMLEPLLPDAELRRDVYQIVKAAALVANNVEVLSDDDPFFTQTKNVSPDVMSKLSSLLEPVEDLQSALFALNQMLRLDQNHIERSQENEWGEKFGPYSSDLGVSLITESLGQMASICVKVLDACARACMLVRGAVPCAGPLAVHYRAYSSLVWLRTAALQPYRHTERDEPWRLALQSVGMAPISLGSSSGGLVAAWWKHVTKSLPRHAHLQMNDYLNCLAYSLWAVSGEFEFGLWLGSIRQPKLVESYVRMLEPWCEWNTCSRFFILGMALLELGDGAGAYAAFCKAAKGVTNEQFLIMLIGETPQSHQQATVLYYLKVVKLFEIYEKSEYVVRIAESAISIAERDDPNLSVFQWRVFKREVEVGSVGRALAIAATLSTPRSRANAAALLLTTLGSQGRLSELVGAGARGAMAEELEKAASLRAKNISPVNNVYCAYLYAEKVKRGHFRKAAWIMYEQACRCEAEGRTPILLTARFNCLLAAVNCLRLTPKEHAFIVTHSANVLDLEKLVKELKKARAMIDSPNDLISERMWIDSKNALVSLATKAANSSPSLSKECFEELRKGLEGADAKLLKQITSIILATGQNLPHWLFTQYMLKDAPALIRVLLSNGRLKCCARAALASLPASLPAIDSLLQELQAHSNDSMYKELYDELKSNLDKYLDGVKSKTNNMKSAGLSQIALTS